MNFKNLFYFYHQLYPQLNRDSTSLLMFFRTELAPIIAESSTRRSG